MQPLDFQLITSLSVNENSVDFFVNNVLLYYFYTTIFKL